MKLHLPKQLFTALLAAITLATPAALTIGSTAWGEEETTGETAESTIAYSGTVYTYTGVNSGTELAFSILSYETDNGTATISGKNGAWGDISAAIAADGDNKTFNTLRFDGTTPTVKALTYTFDPIAVAGFIVESGAEGYSITSSNNADRNIYIGNTSNTKAYTTIDEDFSLTNTSDPDSFIQLRGEQEWQIASEKTFTLTSGSSGITNLSGGNLTISGQGTAKMGSSFTNNGTLTVNDGATLTLSSAFTNAAGAAVSISGALTSIGAFTNNGTLTVNDGATLKLASTLSNNGTLTVNGALATESSSLYKFINATALPTSNGIGQELSFVAAAGNGNATVADGTTMSVSGAEGVALNCTDGKTVTFTTTDSSTYYVVSNTNTSAVGTLSDKNIYIANGASLTQDTTSFTNVTLVGDGVYNYTAPISGSIALPATLHSTDWRGTVSLSGGYDLINLTIQLNQFVTSNSQLELKGLLAYAQNGAIAPDLILTNKTADAIGTISMENLALRLQNGTSTNDQSATFSGAISGSGSMAYTWSTVGTGANATKKSTYIFSGNTSSWDGWFVNHENSGKYVEVQFTKGGQVFDEAGNGGVIDRRADGSSRMDVVINNTAGTATQFYGAVKNARNLTVSSATTFHKDISTSTMTATGAVTLGDGVNLTLLGSAGTANSIGTLSAASGAIKLSGGELTIGTADTAASHSIGALSGTGAVTLAGGTLSTTQALTIGEGLSLTVDSGATLLLGGMLNGTAVDATNNITLNGTVGLAAGVNAADVFTLDSATYSASHDGTGTASASGYRTSGTYSIGSNISMGADASLANGFSLTDGVLKYTDSAVDENTFYVNEDAAWGDTGFTDNNATHYVVAAGKTFNVSWNGDNYGLAGKEVVLDSGAKLTNDAKEGNDAVPTQTSWKQLQSLSLLENATIAGSKQFGLLGGDYANTNLYLNGHTLTKEGSNTFLLINTVVNAGTLDIKEGTVQVGCNSGNKVTDAGSATFKLSGGALTVNNGDTLKVAGLTGESSGSVINGSGSIQLVGEGDYTTAAKLGGSVGLTINKTGSQTITAGEGWAGSLTLTSGTLNLKLDSRATLNKSSINKTGGTLHLSGSGVYDLGSSTSANVSGLTETAWTGTVKKHSAGDIDQLNTYANANSTLDLSGVNAWISNGQAFNGTLQLTNNGDTAALSLDDGYSNNAKATFAGTIKGTGDISYIWSGGTKDITAEHTFSAATNEWGGKFVAKSTNKNVSLSFTKAGNVFDGDSERAGVENASAYKLTVNVGSSDENGDITFGGTIGKTGTGTVELNVTNNKVTFNKTVNVDKLTVAQGASAQLGNTMTVGGVSFSASESATAESPAKLIGQSANALAQLAEDASFTIQDMTLTNTTVTATTPTTKVNFSNATADGNFLLNVAAATTLTAPTVGAGGEEGAAGIITYSYGLGLTTASAENNSITLNLDVVNAVAPSQSGQYTLVVELTNFDNSVFGSLDDATWQSLVGFQEGSWLAEVITAPSTVTDGGSPAAPTVSYGYATGGEGSNVGTLTITIAGLNVPEPTTATLSLLALAALAARRRRND